MCGTPGQSFPIRTDIETSYCEIIHETCRRVLGLEITLSPAAQTLVVSRGDGGGDRGPELSYRPGGSEPFGCTTAAALK